MWTEEHKKAMHRLIELYSEARAFASCKIYGLSKEQQAILDRMRDIITDLDNI